MAKVILDLSGLGGLAPRHYGDKPYASTASHPELRVLGKDNMYADGIVNPLRFLGHLSPANNTFKGSATLTGNLAKASIADTVNFKGYLFEASTRLHQIDTNFLAVTLDTDADFARSIAGAIGTDLEFYTVNGTRMLFYSYYKSSASNIGIHTPETSTFDDDWLSAACSGGAVLQDAYTHKMVVADNGFMYVLDKDRVHKIDGTTAGGANGTATMNVLLFPSTFQCLDGIDLRGKMWILIFRNSRNPYGSLGANTLFSDLCGVYIWDRQSSVVNFQDFIPLEGVREPRAIVSFRGVPWIFNTSSNFYTELRKWNNSRFEVMQELNKNAFPPYPDSIAVDSNFIKWLGNDGNFYYYGSPSPGIPDGLYILGSTTMDAAGAILAVGGDETASTNRDNPEAIYLTYDATGYQVKKWYPHAYTPDGNAQTSHIGNFYSIVKQLPPMSTVKSITIVYPKTTSTASTTTELTAKIYFNQSTTSWGSIVINRNDGVNGFRYATVNAKDVNSVQIELEYNVSSALSLTNTVHPRFAIVEYVETTKKV